MQMHAAQHGERQGAVVNLERQQNSLLGLLEARAVELGGRQQAQRAAETLRIMQAIKRVNAELDPGHAALKELGAVLSNATVVAKDAQVGRELWKRRQQLLGPRGTRQRLVLLAAALKQCLAAGQQQAKAQLVLFARPTLALARQAAHGL